MFLGYCTFHKFYYVLVITAGFTYFPFLVTVRGFDQTPKTSLDLPQNISIQCPFDTGYFEKFCTVGL